MFRAQPGFGFNTLFNRSNSELRISEVDINQCTLQFLILIYHYMLL